MDRRLAKPVLHVFVLLNRNVINENVKFIQNRYYNWYMRICAGWQCTKDLPNDYTERHHILPRCMGGLNDKNNIAILSFRKHFLAHWLLIKCTIGTDRSKMFGTIWRLTHTAQNGKRIISSWQFALARVANSKPKVGRQSNFSTNFSTPEFKAGHSSRMTNIAASKKWRLEKSQSMTQRHLDPLFKAFHSERMKAYHAKKTFEQRQAATRKARIAAKNKISYGTVV